jgi:hypothetical protein
MKFPSDSRMATNNEFRGAPGLLILGFAIVLIVMAAHAYSVRARDSRPPVREGEHAAKAP